MIPGMDPNNSSPPPHEPSQGPASQGPASHDPYKEGAQPNGPQKGEPIFKVPFVPLVVALGMVALYAVQPTMLGGGMELALKPAELPFGYIGGLFTHMLVHGSWVHVIMNSVAIIAFGSPVARDFDKSLGAIGWLLFFIVCGVLGGLGYAAMNWGSYVPVVGASGAAFGLIGASLRLMAGPGFLIPLLNPSVLRGAAVWMGVNWLTGVLGGSLTGSGVSIAWEAHAFGFLAGIILIGPFHHLFSRKIFRLSL